MNPKTLHKVSYGLYVVGSNKEDKLNGQIANAVFQITSEPPTMAVSINKQNLTHEFIRDSGAFAVSILSTEVPMTFIGQFGFKSGRDIDKFKDVNYKIGVTGAPVALDYAIGYLEAKVVNSMDCGSHTVFLGQVEDAEILNDKEPMTYAYYHIIKGGKAPKTAPTYIQDDVEKPPAKQMDKYECLVCGYVYDPAVGDADSGIKPGTPFEEIPDDWVCPVCGAAKDQFRKIS